MSLEVVANNKCFGGWHKQYSHQSRALNCKMRFAVYLPPPGGGGKTGSCTLLVVGPDLQR